MMKLPIEASEKIDNRQQIVLALRTPMVGLIAPYTITINRTLAIFSICRWLILLGVQADGPFYLGAFALWIIIAFRVAWFETVRWQRNLYVVTRDTVNTSQKGRVYHIKGDIALNLSGKWSHQDDPITGAWPSFSTETPMMFNIWFWLTGEEMEQVLLDDPGHNVQISSKAISPKFRKTISKIQGERNRDQVSTGPPDVATANAIRDSFADGLLEKEVASGMLKIIFGRAVYE